MSNSADSDLIPNEHYEILQMDLVKRGLNRSLAALSAEEDTSLRDFNAELLSRIGDFRKKNLELARSEYALRMELAQVEKREREREQGTSERYEREIENLKRTVTELQLSNEHSNEEWNRKYTALSDEKWERELEIENLKKKEIEQQETISRMAQQIAEQTAKEASRTEESKREHQRMTSAYEALRGEYSSIEACYHAANETVLQLRSEIHALTARYEQALLQQKDQLRHEHKTQSELIVTENAQLRSMLLARDTKLDADRSAVQALRERLAYLDQHLGQVGERVRRDKVELTKVSKCINEELQFALTHPFTEYLQIAELEVAQLERQLGSSSQMAPHRQKLEARLNQAVSHRDGIKAILNDSQSDLARHAKTVHTIFEVLAADPQ